MLTLLTKTGGWLSPFAYLFGLIMNGIFEFFSMFGIQNIALTIIIFTIFTRALMLPLTIRQQKFSKLSAVMNPEIQKIQAKYKGKKDDVSLRKQQEETQIVYQKYGTNPTSGCLPMLITLPIMFALYAVINNIPAYVEHVNQLYTFIALEIQKVNNYPELLATLAESIKTYKVTNFDTTSSIIDLLKHFNDTSWAAFATSFPDIQNAIVNDNSLTVAGTINSIAKVNSFIGFNIANPPGWRFPAILIPILAGGLQFIQGKQIQVKTNDSNKDNPMAASMNSMNVVMPLMSAFFCVTFPIGIGIYWITSSAFAIVQQFFVNKYMERIDVNDLIKKNLAKQTKKNKHLEAKGLSMADLAKTQTRKIESTVVEKTKNTITDEIQNNVAEKENNEENTTSNGPKSISEIANLLKNRNEKGDK